MTKDELIEAAKPYFSNEDVDMMFATGDGHFFHAHSKNHAMNQAKIKSVQMFEITRADLADAEDKAPKAAKVEAPVEKTAPADTSGEERKGVEMTKGEDGTVTGFIEEETKSDKPKVKPKKKDKA